MGFELNPSEFWGMTPIEFQWLYPEEEKPTGAYSLEWLAEMKRRYPDG